MTLPNIERILALPLNELGESPHWDQDSQSLLYVDAFKSKIHRYFPSSGKHQILLLNAVTKESGDSVTFVIPVEGRQDLFLISVGRHIGLVRWSASDPLMKATDLTPLTEVDQDRPANRLNDGKCDHMGQLWAGTKGVETEPGVIEEEKGNLYMFSEKMETKLLTDKINLSNGLAWSKDKQSFYYIDTCVFSVDCFSYDSDNDSIANRQKLVDYKGVGLTEDCPDGMTVDTDGNLWVANYLGSKIVCISPKERKIIRTIDMPIQNPTCVTFGGDDYSDLYVTTSQFGFTENELKEKPDSGGVFRITGLGVKGYPPYKAKLHPDILGKI